MDVLKSPQKGLLRRVFSGFRLTQHAIAQVIDMFLVGFHQIGEGFVATLLGLKHPGHLFAHTFSFAVLLTFTQEAPGGCIH